MAKSYAGTTEVDRELLEYGPAERGNTRERILDIALDLFSVQGYDKTSIREISDKLGLSKASIYYHFPSKEEILVSLRSGCTSSGEKP